VQKYATIDFKSKRIVNGGGKLQLIGDLTMHGTTREVTLDVDGPTPEVPILGKLAPRISAPLP